MRKTITQIIGLFLLLCMIPFSLIGCAPADDTTGITTTVGGNTDTTTTTETPVSGDAVTTTTASTSADISDTTSTTTGKQATKTTTTAGNGVTTTTTTKTKTPTTTTTALVVEKTYNGAHGITMSYSSGRTVEEFTAHRAALEKDGYQLYTSNSIGENQYATYRKNGQYLHTYFTAYAGEIRTVKDPFSNVQFATKAQSYTKITDTTVVQLVHTGDWGMGYVIMLEDGRFVVIDGGVNDGDGVNANRLYNVLKQLNKRADGKIVIAAWIITHEHSDHIGMFRDFAARHSGKVTLEQMIINTQGERGAGGENYAMDQAFLNDVKKFGSDVSFWAPQVGQEFYLANARFEVLHTVYSMFPYDFINTSGNINNTSLVLRMEVAGQTILWPGDIVAQASEVVCNSFGEYLKSDILQIPHHGSPNQAKQEFYQAVWPEVLLWDTASWNIRKWGRNNPEIKYALNEMEVEEYHVADGKCKMMVLPYEPGNIVELDISTTVE